MGHATSKRRRHTQLKECLLPEPTLTVDNYALAPVAAAPVAAAPPARAAAAASADRTVCACLEAVAALCTFVPGLPIVTRAPRPNELQNVSRSFVTLDTFLAIKPLLLSSNEIDDGVWVGVAAPIDTSRIRAKAATVVAPAAVLPPAIVAADWRPCTLAVAALCTFAPKLPIVARAPRPDEHPNTTGSYVTEEVFHAIRPLLRSSYQTTDGYWAGHADLDALGAIRTTAWTLMQRGMAATKEKPLSVARDALVAGVDISYGTGALEGVAYAAVVVYRLPDLDHPVEVVVQQVREPMVPYVAGFLGFREVPVLAPIVAALTNRPDVLMVDGNGRLHPRGCGSAAHLGYATQIPSLGVAKRLHTFLGLTVDERKVMLALAVVALSTTPVAAMVGSGRIRGMALIPCKHVWRPIYVSAGHGMTLDAATRLTARCSWYRSPEPIRQADMRSREALRNHPQA